MFFSIQRSEQHTFTHSYGLRHGWHLNTDSGWQTLSNGDCQAYYKGYSSDVSDLKDVVRSLIQNKEGQYKGNFCAVIDRPDGIHVMHDDCRGFPLWRGDTSVSNLTPLGDPVWSDRRCVIVGDEILDQFVDTVEGSVQPVTGTRTQLVREIHEVILSNFENFLRHNNDPIKIFLTGGIDSTTCYSYLKKFTRDFESVDYEFKKFTHFYKHNWKPHLKSLWGYTQIHSWGDQPAALITGACGDEYFMRGPYTANLWLMMHGTDVNSVMADKEHEYHFSYFARDKNQITFREQDTPRYKQLASDASACTKYIRDNLLNDHQHWHIDRTITFTPFKDKRIIDLMMKLPLVDYEQQILRAQINRDLISLNDPKDLELISPQKNSNNFAVL